MWLILQALEYGARFHSEELHLQELGVATLSALFANANRDPKKGQPASPKDFFYFKQEEDDGPKIPAIVCDIFFSLVADGLMPGWALGIAPIDRLRAGKSNNPVIRKPRAWISEDLVLILPKVDGKQIMAAFAISNQARGFVLLNDVDTGTEFCLTSETSEVMWSLEPEFELFNHEFGG